VEEHKKNTNLYPRPKLISFHNCNNVLIEGVTLTNSPSWTVNPILCENVTVDKITIKNPADSPNTDGINPESCKNVHISNCHIDVGDDCITLKSGTEDTELRVPCENITITNCTMVHGHGGVVIGSEMSGDIRNVTISNCVFECTDRGIRMKSRRGRGGVVEDIRINNIVMKDVLCPFIANLYYFCGPKGKDKYVWDKDPYPITSETPAFRRIHFSNITARKVRAAAGFLYGLSEMYIEDVSFENISIAMAQDAEPGMADMMSNLDPMKQRGFFCSNVKDITFNNVTISNNEGPAFYVENGINIEFVRCKTKDSKGDDPMIKLVSVL
jgi:polygalacturonase